MRQPPSANWFVANGTWLLTVLLGALMTFAVVQSIAVSNWARGLTVMVPVAVGGVVVGAIFARLRWLPGYLAHPLSALLGIAWMVQRVGPQMESSLVTWRDHAIELLIRTIIVGRLFVHGGTGDDLLLFVALLALVAWALAYSTIWLLLRHSWAWTVVLINAILLFVNLTYASPKPPISLFFLFDGAALLIIVQQNFLQRARTWDAAQMEYPDFLGWRFVASGMLVVAAVLLGTTLLPTRITAAQVAHVWQRVREPWQQVQARWDRTFSTINAPANAAGGGFSGKTFTLAGARTLGTNLVMEVQSPRFDYWRATAYDRYDGRLSWPNTTGDLARAATGRSVNEDALTPLNPNTVVPLIDTSGRQTITQTFYLHQSFAIPTLFSATQPVMWSIPTLVEHTFLSSNGTSIANFTDTSMVQAQGSVVNGLTYTVVSSVADTDKASLRAAATSYPDWVKRYLQLPSTLPQRLRDKTHAIVVSAKAENPYDKAEAIQNFLRTFPYDEKIPSPPEDRDVVDYFVFDLQRGYCDYFASAMVVMLRTEGVPARIAQGYAGGEFNAQTNRYDVRQNLAHTWPEVYFPGYGWQRFEPTPASYAHPPDRAESAQGSSGNGTNQNGIGRDPQQDALDRIEKEIAAREGQAPLTAEATREALEARAKAAALARLQWEQRAVVGGGLLAALLSGVWIFGRQRQFGPAALVYARLLRWATWAGIRPKPSATPQEVAASLAKRLPAQQGALNSIAGAFTREQYAREKTGGSEIEQTWRRVRLPLVTAVLRRFTHPSPRVVRTERRPRR